MLARLRNLPAIPAMVLVTLIWGGNFSASKFALTRIPVLPFSALRFLLASACLWGNVRLVEPRVTLPRGTLLRLIGLGIIGNTLYQIAFMTGLTMTTATNSSLLVASTPMAVIVLGRLFGVERPNRAVWAAVGLGTAGVVLVVLSKGGGAAFGSATVTGDLLTFAAVLCWAVFTLGIRALQTDISPLRLTAIATTAGMPGLVLLSLPQVGDVAWTGLGWEVWAAVAYASFLSIVVAYILWNAMVRQVGSARTALLGMMVPLWAVLIASVTLGERPTTLQVLGASCILGSVLVSRLGQPAPVLAREDEAAS
jgi:drug/metabolite transporter (DMT)-like permease